ncbi:hypothetical protein PLICRDRAFT_57334 [Plicaturopsis crispa FD-325 SS-3]|uniref:2-(3-amino-3-carboxypropyl)histidine synthase subunit 2 n=1 Tax=Plicaturopsis crispa FD-325 SS-3 TaxID=944288 RepID=A0A0C9SRM7_PLICR|nr:hypothetical protein PLICRDRAFT_57334 [Plicaturopsis crispa FD-325 SS-3]
MSADPTTISASGEDAITRTIDVNVDETPNPLSSPDEFEDYYEINRTAEEIARRGYKRIALQFPDELLHDSVPIYRLLKSKIEKGQELYVLADTSYGSCCVDEVAAQHVDADALVHYGHACMSQTSRLPHLNVDACVSSLIDSTLASKVSAEGTAAATSVLLRHDVAYTRQADEIVRKLRHALRIPVLYAPIPTSTTPPTAAGTERTVNHPDSNAEDVVTEDPVILYVGGESLGLTNLLMAHNASIVYSFDPCTNTGRLESGRTNRLLMRRYAVVQKSRDADVFGILVGTLGVASYLPLITHIRRLLAQARKKSYTITVGKLNPAKLANFMEIECFVLVACPENSIIDTKDFLRPIITPYELEIALKAEQSWTGRYVLDFERLLNAEPSEETPESREADEEDPDQPVFSMVTGKYRHAKRYGGEEAPSRAADENTSALVRRNQDGVIAKIQDNAAGQFLRARTYQGLEQRLGEDAPGVLEQGRSGIAKGYKDDHASAL